MRAIATRVGVPVVAMAVLIAAGLLLYRRHHVAHVQAPPPPPEEPECVLRAEPARPVPGPDIYQLLDKCLRAHQPWHDAHVTVDQIRTYVEIEHDPVWLEDGAWWMPMSGEGKAQAPSGLYISVPLDGSPCGGAIIN